MSYKLGYRLGMWEHRFRYFAIKVLGVGVLSLIGGYYFWNRMVIFISLIVVSLATILEFISLVFHWGEKKAMHNIRHGRR